MAFINFAGAAAVSAPSGLWTWLILDVFSFIGNYGWAVVLFTLSLKLLLSPLDIYQRVAMKKNQRITERIQPELDKLKKQYANNPAALQKKQQEINKREGYSLMAGCLPMLVTLIISIWLLTELTGISRYKNMANYVELYHEYTAAELSSYARVVTDDGLKMYEIETDADGTPIAATINLDAFGLPEDISEWGATEEYRVAADKLLQLETQAQKDARLAGRSAVSNVYDDVREGFLWVQNIWVADVPWNTSVMNESDFKKAVSKYATEPHRFYGVKKGMVTAEQVAEWERILSRYTEVTEVLQNDETKNFANGYLVLPILSIAVMLTSQILMRRIQSKSGIANPTGAMGAGNGKMMVFMMPVMFGIFALFYTTAFSLYMIVNSTIMIVVSLSAGLVMRLVDRRDVHKTVTQDGILRIGRPDPNAPTAEKEQNPHGKKGKK